MKTERVENMAGGRGHVTIKHILGEKELNGKCRLYAEVTIEPGCVLWAIMSITGRVRRIIFSQGTVIMMTTAESVR